MVSKEAQRQSTLHAMAKRLLRFYPTELDLPNTFLLEERKALAEKIGEGLKMKGSNDQGITIEDVIELYLSEYAGKTIQTVR